MKAGRTSGEDVLRRRLTFVLVLAEGKHQKKSLASKRNAGNRDTGRASRVPGQHRALEVMYCMGAQLCCMGHACPWWVFQQALLRAGRDWSREMASD